MIKKQDAAGKADRQEFVFDRSSKLRHLLLGITVLGGVVVIVAVVVDACLTRTTVKHSSRIELLFDVVLIERVVYGGEIARVRQAVERCCVRLHVDHFRRRANVEGFASWRRRRLLLCTEGHGWTRGE